MRGKPGLLSFLDRRLPSRFSSAGQVTPFTIAIIVVLLMALMVAVNIGKVGLFRINASNAADSGALAGGTLHTNTLNAIGYINSDMQINWLSVQATFAYPVTVCYERARYLTWIAFMATQAYYFAEAERIGNEGYDEARNQAYKLAFSNAGISEWKARSPGEPYDQYLQRDTDLQNKLQDEDYKFTGSSETYSWGDSSVVVNVDTPDFPGLIPSPAVLQGVYYDAGWPCICDCCAGCVFGRIIPVSACLSISGAPYSNLTLVATVVGYPTGCTSCMPSGTIISTPTVSDMGLRIWDGGGGTCYSGFWFGCTYIVPIAFIADIIDDDPEIDVTVTKNEADKDLGIWNMRYKDPNTQGGIRSNSRARTSGGTIGPIASSTYEPELTGGW